VVGATSSEGFLAIVSCQKNEPSSKLIRQSGSTEKRDPVIFLHLLDSTAVARQ